MDKPGYWAVIPAAVRYDPALPPNATLLYGEIIALFGLSDRSVCRLLAALAKGGCLRIDVLRDPATNAVQERRLYAVYGQEEAPPPPDKNGGENNTSIYNYPL